jgi:hypothetical protein
MNLMTSWCVLHKSDSSDDDFSMNSMAIMTMFERRQEVATPIIDGGTTALDGDNSSA